VKKRMKTLARIGLFLALAFGLFLGFMYYRMGQAGADHARFSETGKTINSFLKDYGKAFAAAHTNGDLSTISTFYAADYHAEQRGSWQLNPGEMVGGSLKQDLQIKGDTAYNKQQRMAEMEAYIKGLSAIDSIRYKIHLIEDIQPDSATLTVKYVMDGKDESGRLLQDRDFYRWRLSTVDDDLGWKISADYLTDGVRVTQARTTFVKADPVALGIDFSHRRDPKLDIKKHGHELKFAVIEHAMGGISAADYDGDGRPDLFFTDGIQSRLYRNVTQQTDAPAFQDVTSAVGLDGLDQAVAGIFADFDNDGDQDLFVSRYMVPNAYYENNGDQTFSERAADVGLNHIGPSVSVTLLDYDNDGWLDLYLGQNGDAYNEAPRLPFFARNAKANMLYRNVEGRFEDVSEKSGTGDTGWTLAVAAGDFNGDGLPDIGVANDFGRKNMYRNNGDGTFSEISKEMGTLDFSGGMGLVFGDFNEDGHQDLYTSNIKSNQRWFGEDQTINQYINNVMRTRWMFVDMAEYRELFRLKGMDWPGLGQEIGEGNSLFYNNGDETFRELEDSHTNQAGWSWSVVSFDFDNDTDLDLYAANGWISNKPGTDL